MRNRLFWLFTAVLFSWLPKADAEPYLAAWKGVNCNACHLNQTGGWGRNDFGKNYGNSLETFDWKGLSEAAQTIKHVTPSWVSTGIDIHESYTATFNQNSGLNQNSFYQANPFFPGRGSFSLCAKANEVVSGVFTYRLDEQLLKEFYAQVSGLPEGLYFKLGQFLMPYGLTLADDNSLVRGALGAGNNFSFDNTTSHGAEVGIYPGPFFVNAAIANGNSSPLMDLTGAVTYTLSEKIVSAKGGLSFPEATIGGSIYGENLDTNSRKLRGGAYGWGHLGPVVLLAEYDNGYDASGDPVNPLRPVTMLNYFTAYHGSLEVDLGKSVYLRATSEYIDHSVKQASVYDGFRHVLSLRCYPVRNLKLQVDGTRMDATPGSPYQVAVKSPNYALTVDAFIFY